jgi:hypothetical protein
LPATSLFPEHEGFGGVAIYSQGALGGQIGQNGIEITARDGTVFEKRNRSFARTDAYGEMVAEQAFLALEQAVPVDASGLRFAAKRYLAPVDNQAYHVGWFAGWFDRDFLDWDENAPLGDDNRPHIEMEVDLFAIGPIVFLTAPGELHPEAWVGYDEKLSLGQPYIRPENPNPPPIENVPTEPPLKARVDGAFPMLLGLGQDESGYLIPPYNFVLDEVAPWIAEAPGDHYEETNSIGVEALPRYLEIAHGLIEYVRNLR